MVKLVLSDDEPYARDKDDLPFRVRMIKDDAVSMNWFKKNRPEKYEQLIQVKVKSLGFSPKRGLTKFLPLWFRKRFFPLKAWELIYE